jgi:hypothetical protein
MPDPILILKSMLAAAIAAALVFMAAGTLRTRKRIAGVSAVAASVGITVGILTLGAIPQYPPREDQDRLLLILLPAAVVAELIAAILPQTSWAKWLPRLAVAATAAPILLHGSVYLSGTVGPDSLGWGPQDKWLILVGLAAALAVEWMLLERLAVRDANRGVVASLTLAVGGAGIAVMLTGYATGGMLGAPLAGALGGLVLASLCFSGLCDLRGALGVGLTSLFALVVVGRFFGDMTTTNAVLLFLAPLAGWLPELVPALRSRPFVRGTARLHLVVVPLAIALALAVIKFKADSESKSPAPGANEPSAEDYLNFGK